MPCLWFFVSNIDIKYIQVVNTQLIIYCQIWCIAETQTYCQYEIQFRTYHAGLALFTMFTLRGSIIQNSSL